MITLVIVINHFSNFTVNFCTNVLKIQFSIYNPMYARSTHQCEVEEKVWKSFLHGVSNSIFQSSIYFISPYNNMISGYYRRSIAFEGGRWPCSNFVVLFENTEVCAPDVRPLWFWSCGMCSRPAAARIVRFSPPSSL